MTEAKKILEMIEVHAAGDYPVLGQLNSIAWGYIYEYYKKASPSLYNRMKRENWSECYSLPHSRDALKLIRPKGFTFSINIWQDGSTDVHVPIYNSDNTRSIPVPILPTEELAELYLIIQIIRREL